MTLARPHPTRPGASVTAAGTAFGGAREGAVDWVLPEEVPIVLSYNRRRFGVMLASPSDLEDFGLGFTLAERIAARADEVSAVVVSPSGDGFAVAITIPEERAALVDARKRALEARSGCGLCGLEDADAFHRPLPRVRDPRPAPEALLRAFAVFKDRQPMRARNYSVHGAAWCGADGDILLVREDVGRHSALDKLIGAMARAGHDPATGFVLMSSRCGFELVQKAAAFGVGFLACVSAPTSLALAKASDCGMGLATATRDGGVVILAT